MLIKIKGKELLGIGEMHQIALRWIFDRKSVSVGERTQLEDSIEFWVKLPNSAKDTTWELRRIIHALIADEKGFFDRSKMLQIKHKVDWKKMYSRGLPYINLEGRTSFSKP